MAGKEELGKFVQKFVSLWQSGSNARLHVESEAERAYVSLQVDLGHAQPLASDGQHGRGQGYRGGSPAKQRRRERRESERKAKAAAEQAGAREQGGLGDEKSLTEKVVFEEGSFVAEEVNNLNGSPQVVESEKSEIEYELKIEAHEKCKNFDVVEVIEVNFDGTLDDLKIDKHDPSREIHVQRIKKEPIEDDNKPVAHFVYRVKVKNTEVARTLIESWKHSHKFDDLAFGNAVYDKVQVKIREVQKIKK